MADIRTAIEVSRAAQKAGLLIGPLTVLLIMEFAEAEPDRSYRVCLSDDTHQTWKRFTEDLSALIEEDKSLRAAPG